MACPSQLLAHLPHGRPQDPLSSAINLIHIGLADYYDRHPDSGLSKGACLRGVLVCRPVD